MYRFLFLFLFTGLVAPPSISLQAQDAPTEAIGFYISSKFFSFSEILNMEVTQFLTQGEEDRSYAGKLKPEFMIQLGWLLSAELQEKFNVDTVIFLNADPPLGKAFQEAFDPFTGRLSVYDASLKSLDKVVVLRKCEIRTRRHRSVYIQSNRMLTEYIPVKVGQMEMQEFDMQTGQVSKEVTVCMDEISGPKVTNIFGLYNDRSKLGKYLSRWFSQWWLQSEAGAEASCKD
ncbi:MAG: hypothetical protein AAFR61_28735 [Bacteroidota bacterium]